MAAFFRFEVFTPYRLFFADSAESVILTLADGDIEILARHSAFTAPVSTGVLRIKTSEGDKRRAFISSGILEVTGNKTVLMVDAAEWPEEIDTERAIASGKQARETLKTAMLKFEVDNAKNRIRRSDYRLKVAGMLQGENK